MTTPEQRLAELGLELPEVVTPLASYVPAVRSGSYVYTSGQVPMVQRADAGDRQGRGRRRRLRRRRTRRAPVR